MNDPLAVYVRDIDLPISVALMTGYEPDLFFDGDRFMAYLCKTYEEFDVATYSVSKSINGCPLRRIQRLIYGLRQGATNARPKSKKYVMNCHLKLYICYKDKNVADVFVGNQNLTYGTNLNLMYRVRAEHHQCLVSFFNQLWNTA